ncbi:MAG: 4Fe-4S binding protein [Chitinivibrionales bacterium]|nr:4Fe-4S binding protein [Chitinivibrionales bacterium]
MKLPSFYFNWLQKDNPTGTVDRFPELKNKFETTVPGIYCAGDLTGIPLIKLAAESGYKIIERLAQDEQFAGERNDKKSKEIYDLVILGAGPAGISASLHAAELGFRHIVLESSQKFNTIVNFPAGKPVYVTPEKPPMKSDLKFSEGTKETLLDEFNRNIENKNLPLKENETVKKIEKTDGYFIVESSQATYKALRVIVAIGKTGNARRLKVPGEDLPKVYTRLIDPGEHTGQDILVVGGGDSALEAAVALAKTGNNVTLSYRKAAFSRPKERNTAAFNQLVEQGKITPIFESTVKEIKEKEVVLTTKDGEQGLPNDAVFALIGTEIPIQFFKRSGIRMEGEKGGAYYFRFAALLLFSCVLYFGKKAPVTKIGSLAEFFSIPRMLFDKQWPSMVNGILAWASYMGMLMAGVFLLGSLIVDAKKYFDHPWNSFKYSFYGAILILFGYIYLSYNLGGNYLLGYAPGFWYTAMYSLTIVIFGFRRIHMNPTGYIKRQTWALMAFQCIPLFILPVFVFPFLGNAGLLGPWIMENVFPGESYWRAYGLILAWPLFIHNLATGQPTMFWLLVGLAQAFVIIPWLNFKWGKGAYCGWICSCGALAETLGDEYRTKAPHGPAAKKTDNVGQVVLWFAGIMTIAIMLSTWFHINLPFAGGLKSSYEIVVDIIFAGVLGLGVYFFLSGRLWCRWFCPLAALMHIYTRFSVYRIFANKKRCISCNICTKVCHMGIDVMGYANKGIPMNDVECVRCSACIVNCPMQVLTFGEVDTIDLDNTRHTQKHFPLQPGWQSGLPKKDIEMRLEEERGGP